MLTNDDFKKYIDYLTKWIINEVKNAKCKGVVFGLSGGIDSSVIASLAKKAFPSNHLGLIMPVNENTLDFTYGVEFARDKKISSKIINIKTLVDEFSKITEFQNDKLIIGNTAARFRMNLLYSYAKKNNYLVLGTSNFCEWYIGYFTKYGDGGADLYPILNLLKSEVKMVGKLLNVPGAIINRAPSASLWEGQTDEGDLEFTYNDLEDFLNNKKVDDNKILRINYLNKISSHKRNDVCKPKNLIDFKKI